MSNLYVLGSGECEQLGLKFKEDDIMVVKIPTQLSFFNKLNVFKVVCGGLHTVALATNGDIYSWGCNDEGALGRDGPESYPAKVTNVPPMTKIAAGDSHSLASDGYNLFFWGTYRDMSGKMVEEKNYPTRTGAQEFKSKYIQKIAAGAQHSVVLASGKIFTMGDSESGKIGRKPTPRRRVDQSLQLEELKPNKVENIFAGGHHSFYIKEDKVFAWGRNNYGQLGLGYRDEAVYLPTEIEVLRDVGVIDIAGGESHSLAVTKDFKVYSWGKNDEGQLGTNEEELEASEEPKEIPFFENLNITRIQSGGDYNYARGQDDKMYSWGFGENYVLGTRKEKSLFLPREMDLSHFQESNVLFAALGSQHAVFLTTSPGKEIEDPPTEISSLTSSAQRLSISDTPQKKNDLKRENSIDMVKSERKPHGSSTPVKKSFSFEGPDFSNPESIEELITTNLVVKPVPRSAMKSRKSKTPVRSKRLVEESVDQLKSREGSGETKRIKRTSSSPGDEKVDTTTMIDVSPKEESKIDDRELEETKEA
mmetsp:Transcript_34851/g.39501  ORF Transcript_34851/g.39501 Transcript_34851/m.39501 type:complete len:534 (+) Transcript_34851:58-1659(+)